MRKEENYGIYHKLIDIYWEKAWPFAVHFELTHRCNLNCCHCYIVNSYEGKNELSTEEIKESINQFAKSNVVCLTFTGGEVFIRDDFFEIATYARKKEFNIKLLTNGTLITPDIADRIREIYPQGVDISIYGSKASTHDKITRVEGSFEKSMKGIKLLRERGINVTIKSLLMRQNFKEYSEIKQLALQLGARFQYSFTINAKNDGSTAPHLYRLSNNELASFFRFLAQKGEVRIIHERKNFFPPSEETRKLSPCGVGRATCAIFPTGKVFPCVMLLIEAGDLRKQDFQSIWNSSEIFLMLRTLTIGGLECGKCDLFYYCFIKCIGQSFLEDGDLRKCCTEARRITNILRKEVNKNVEFEKESLYAPCD